MIVVGKSKTDNHQSRATNSSVQEAQMSKEGQVLSYNKPVYAS